MGYAHRLEGVHRIQLKDFDPREDAGLKRKEAEQQTASLLGQVIELQELLYAVRQQSVLIILQGRDTSGKDQIPPDLVVKYQAIDIIEVILSPIW